ncbi:C39 family peptidase [Speluncibacter jeojiensis]|uniref:C39 family peptidase n=1 Tax=Speluncibacter jeojiensis TaxID=2710754 RepID=A0A9X4M3D5_9ACTN|nr:C39 family peptidase [Corynebacteriales bacterium D3-21]
MDFGTGHDELTDTHHDGDQLHAGEDAGVMGHMGEALDAVDGGLGPAIFDDLIHGFEDLLDGQDDTADPVGTGHSGPDHAGLQSDPQHQPVPVHEPAPSLDPMDPQAWTNLGDHSAVPGSDHLPDLGPDGGHTTDSGVDGNPHAWTNDWFFQETDGYCGPSSIAQVVSEYTGLDVHDPQQLVDRAVELGLFDPNHPENGMSWQDMQTLMQDQGVPCHLQSSSMADLEAKLDDGYGVIAMVHAGDIWGEEHDSGHGSDHALVVAGIDHDRGVVILSDPGSPNGNQEEVPIDRFEQAWSASGDQMLVADSPDADLASAPEATPPGVPSSAALESTPWAIANVTGAP